MPLLARFALLAAIDLQNCLETQKSSDSPPDRGAIKTFVLLLMVVIGTDSRAPSAPPVVPRAYAAAPGTPLHSMELSAETSAMPWGSLRRIAPFARMAAGDKRA